MSNTNRLLNDYMERQKATTEDVANLTGIPHSRLIEILSSTTPLTEDEWQKLEKIATKEIPITASLLKQLDPNRVAEKSMAD